MNKKLDDIYFYNKCYDPTTLCRWLWQFAMNPGWTIADSIAITACKEKKSDDYTFDFHLNTVCPGSSDPFYIVTLYIK